MLTPGTGNMQARRGTAARYRQTVTAVDWAAHAVPSVSPYNPAVRVAAVRSASAALPCVGQPVGCRSCL